MPDVVIVSDDSRESSEIEAICSKFPFVQYFKGPQRGLCANRNAAIAHAKTDFVSLIDDDGIVDREFIATLRGILLTLPEKTLISGDVLEYGGRTVPSNPKFLGYFGKAFGAGALQNINLNCNCLPAGAFRSARFDEALFYGYEDMDLCSSLLSQGYHIVHHPELLNRHEPPPRVGADNSRRYRWTQQARFQTSMKRYLVWEKKPLHAVGFFVLAPVHRILHALRIGLFSDIPLTVTDIVLATKQALAYGRNKETI